MSLKDDMVDDLAVFFDLDDFAREIVYGAKTIKAIVDYFKNLDYGSPDVAQRAQIIIRRDDIPDPKNMDYVVLDSVGWNVDNVEAGDEHTWRIRIRRNESLLVKK